VSQTFSVFSRAVLPASVVWNPTGVGDVNYWRGEANLVPAVTQEGGQNMISVSYTTKETYDGLWFENPPVDLSEHPYVSFDIRAAHAAQITIYLWDNRYWDWRDGAGSPYYNTGHGIQFNVPANTWETYT